jgi:hypothetical protein
MPRRSATRCSSVAGQLDLKPGGPGFRLYRYLEDNVATYVPLDRHGPETWRRAVYHQNARASLIDGLTDFDLPDNASTAPTRIRTISPLQALTQLNHRLTLDLADRPPRPDSARGSRGAVTIRFAAPLRSPSSARQRQTKRLRPVELIAAYGWRAFTRALLNANELFFLR